MTLAADPLPAPEYLVTVGPRPASNEEAMRASPALALWWHMARSYQALAARLTRFFEEEGTTGAQFGVLRSVGEAGPEGVKLTDLSKRLMVTCGNITAVVDQLERNGWLRRERSLEDRRVIRAQLTPEGEERYRALVPRYRACVSELLAGLGEEEKRQLADLCARLNETLEPNSSVAPGRERAARSS